MPFAEPELSKLNTKTWKREVAVVLATFVCILHVVGIFLPAATEPAQYLTTPVFLFLSGAYGLDAFAKQIR